MKRIIVTIMTVGLIGSTAFSVELLRADFSGTPETGSNIITIPAADAQLTVHSNVLNGEFRIYGGTAGTTNWAYNATGDALLNEDLFTSSNYGNPTRMDLGLALTTLGKTYTITNIEVVVTATNGTDVGIDLWFARDEAADIRVNTPTVIIPAGTTGTFSIDTTLAYLIATENDATWNQNPASNGDLRLGFFATDGSNVDSMEIAEVRVNGTVEDYVAPVAETNTVWNFNTLGDTEGWSQDVNAHIDGLNVFPAFSGTETVLSSDAITGNDPQLVNYGLFAPAAGYWQSAIIRVRQLDTGGTPLAWDGSGCAVVLGDTIISSAIGGAGWEVTAEAGEWITASIDISELGTNELDYVRFDPVGQASGTNKLFEVDYIQLTSSATPPVPVPPEPSNWEFNTDGDFEGWSQGSTAHISGFAVSNGVLFSEVITGNDPQLIGPAVSVGTYYWSTAEIRIRQLDSGGSPVTFDPTGCSVVINGSILDALGTGAWNVINEADEWIVATLDISYLASGNITSFRFDPVGSPSGTNKNFEVDYVRLNNQPTPIPPQVNWEFNSDGDLEGWTGEQITNLQVTAGVMTADGVTDVDPKLNRIGTIASQGYYWTTAQMRLRQLDSVGTPIPFSTAGLTAVIGGKIIQGSTWNIAPEGSGEWVVATVSLVQLGNDDINNLRFDPVGNDATKNFEVDYIRLNYSLAPLAKILVQSWEFNAGSVEGLTGSGHVSGLLATDAYSGSEKVLTCADVTGNDPQVLLPSPAGIAPTGSWSTLEFRVRQLSANGGPFQTWDTSGTYVNVNGGTIAATAIPQTGKVTITSEADGWVTAVFDIGALGFQNLNNFRLDPVGNSADRNFEIDYIRVYSMKARVGYDAWTYGYALSGSGAAKTADPDNDLYNNLYEYMFGGNPLDNTDTGLLPVGNAIDAGGSNVLEYVYFKRSDPDSGLDYSLEARSALVGGSWAGLTETVDYTEAGSGTYNTEMDAVTNHIPVVADAEFIRTKVTEQ